MHITTNGADDVSDAGDRCNIPSEVTDGSLKTPGMDCPYDGLVGWQNHDYQQLMVITVTIDLQQTCDITKIRYNMVMFSVLRIGPLI